VAKGMVWCIRTAKGYGRLHCSYQDTWALLVNLQKQCTFGKSGFKFAFGRNKKGKVFGILSQLKKLSKSNDVHAQNKTFLSST
jgi:hypothetical protein